jgi:hypothetical protein
MIPDHSTAGSLSRPSTVNTTSSLLRVGSACRRARRAVTTLGLPPIPTTYQG